MEKINVEKAFIISIARTAQQPKRKEHLQRLIKNITNIFEKPPEIYGVDGTRLSESNIKMLIQQSKLRRKIAGPQMNLRSFSFKKPTIHPVDKLVEKAINVYYKRDMRIGEVGCFLSHMGIIEAIVKNKIPSALILEDDAMVLCNTSEFREKVNNAIREINDDFYILSLFRHADQINNNEFNVKMKNYNEDLFKIHSHCFGAVGYIISLKAAQHIINTLYPMKNPFDYALFHEVHRINKGYLTKKPLIDVCLYKETMTRR